MGNDSSATGGWPGWPDGRRAAISLSFDDARLSQLDQGLPILDRHGVKGTFYVSTGEMYRKRIDDWRAAVANGHEIGNHTLTHPCSGNFPFARARPLENYTLDQMEQELLEANTVIERTAGVRPATFAYPCGQNSVGRGEGVRSYVPLVARHFLVGRGAFNEGPTAPDFCDLAHTTGMEADGRTFEELQVLADAAAGEGAWLILFGHEVGGEARQTVRADALDAFCRYVSDPASGLWADTVENVEKDIARTRCCAGGSCGAADPGE